MRKTIITLALTALILPSAGLANNPTPAEAYCDDLQQTVDRRLQESVQRRMPAEMPGDFMNTQFGVDEIISTPVDFGISGGVGSILDRLIGFLRGKLSDVQRSMLNEINRTVSDSTGGAAGGVSMDQLVVPFNPGAQSYSAPATETGNRIVQPSQPLQGRSSVPQPEQAPQQSSGSAISNFFGSLF